jgi:hypothetical protein
MIYSAGNPGTGTIIADCELEKLPFNPVPLGMMVCSLFHTVTPSV